MEAKISLLQLWNTFHHPDYVKSGLQQSLDRLQIKYFDLYLIHWPMAFQVRYWCICRLLRWFVWLELDFLTTSLLSCAVTSTY